MNENCNNKNKKLIEFLEILIILTKNNIDFIIGNSIIKNDCIIFKKYKKELNQIQDLINSFDFINGQDLMNECYGHEWLYNQQRMIASEYKSMCREYQELIQQKNKEIKEKDIQIAMLMNERNRP